MNTNPELDQDRILAVYEIYNSVGDVIFPDQRRIYEFIRDNLNTESVLEAGCGNGIGSSLIERRYSNFLATDKLEANIAFARKLYPWVDFGVWDLNKPWSGRTRHSVVCVEAFEHVADPSAAMKHILDSAVVEAWISTPNGTGKPRPPENEHHVCEYTPLEMLEFILAVNKNAAVEIYDCDTFRMIGVAEVTPKHSTLLYRIRLPQ